MISLSPSSTNNSESEGIQFPIMEALENQQIFTFERLDAVTFRLQIDFLTGFGLLVGKSKWFDNFILGSEKL